VPPGRHCLRGAVVAHFLGKEEVVSSNLTGGSCDFRGLYVVLFVGQKTFRRPPVQYRKSSFCNNSACVEAASLSFTKAAASNPDGACVEAAAAGFVKSETSGANGSCVEAGTARYAKADASSMNGGCVEAGIAAYAKASAAGNCVEAGTAQFAAPADSGDTNCVEAGTASFTKAQASSPNAHCVEHGEHAGMVFVRDSKDPRSETSEFPHLHFPRAVWDGGRAVTFQPSRISDVPRDVLDVAARRGHAREQRWYKVTSPSPQDTMTALYFDQDEKNAWEKGVTNGEFTALATQPVAA
jgi:Domain of unknown function (DUF397)